jgi:hypothetical protein
LKSFFRFVGVSSTIPAHALFLQSQKKPFPSNFDGVISIYCDPAALSPSFGTWREQLEHPKIFGAFGMHPHNAKYYNDSIRSKLIECLTHPKAVAWGFLFSFFFCFLFTEFLIFFFLFFLPQKGNWT